ncbi:MAG: GMC family oxidoreductase [Polyangiaceae bacterium]
MQTAQIQAEATTTEARAGESRPRNRLGPHLERVALALAEAVMPDGHGLPGGSTQTVVRFEHTLYLLGADLTRGVRAALSLIDAATLPSHRRRFSQLPRDERERLVQAWNESSSKQIRWALRVILTPLKAAHFDDDAMFERVGCRRQLDTPRVIEAERWMQAMMDGRKVDEDLELECEVVVIGTGAGGAAVAYELARRGRAVLMVEAGDYHQRTSFEGRAAAAYSRMYVGRGATLALGNIAAPVWAGRTVGGTTTVNSGTCYRAPERTLHRWQARYGLSMLGRAALDPYYDRVEAMLEVAPAERAYLGGSARVIARGAEALGLSHSPLRRNAPSCDGQGVCCFGCPTGAKRSTNVSYVPAALMRGAQLISGADVERVVVRQGRARGIEARLRSGRSLRVKADAVVVAGGALLTPLLLRRSGVLRGHPMLGKNLSIHPATKVLALFDEDIDMSRGIPQSYSIDSLKDDGILCEGASVPMDVAAVGVPWVGSEFMELMSNYAHLASFGLMVQDTSRGEVRAGPRGVPIIRYDLNRHDLERMQRGICLISEVFLRAGARRVLPFVHGDAALQSSRDLERLRQRRLSPGDFEVSAYHPLGTCRLGTDPSRSCLGPDHETHDTEALYVVDGSAVPSSLGVNPQLTIMALALRAGEIIDARLERPRVAFPDLEPETSTGFSFAETMSGTWTRYADDAVLPLAFTIDASSKSLREFAKERVVTIRGTLTAAGLCQQSPAEGTLGMDMPLTGKLPYALEFDGDDGRHYRFEGEKRFDLRAPLFSMTHLPGRIVDDEGHEIGAATVDFDLDRDLLGFLRSFSLTEVRAP